MIIDEFKKANIEAMKSRDMVVKNIIGIVMNKYMVLAIDKRANSQEATDVDMVSIIQKTIKELAEEAENYAKVGNSLASENAKKQSEFIAKYLPQMMGVEEIKKIILAQEDQSMPNIMKLFKNEYAGKCDMRLVQEVLKSL